MPSPATSAIARGSGTVLYEKSSITKAFGAPRISMRLDATGIESQVLLRVRRQIVRAAHRADDVIRRVVGEEVEVHVGSVVGADRAHKPAGEGHRNPVLGRREQDRSAGLCREQAVPSKISASGPKTGALGCPE